MKQDTIKCGIALAAIALVVALEVAADSLFPVSSEMEQVMRINAPEATENAGDGGTALAAAHQPM